MFSRIIQSTRRPSTGAREVASSIGARSRLFRAVIAALRVYTVMVLFLGIASRGSASAGSEVPRSQPGGVPAAAASADGDDTDHADIVEVDGPLDVPQRDLVRDAVERASGGDTVAIILRINSPGALAVDALAEGRRVRDSEVPVLAWVGDGTAEARGSGLVFFAAADVRMMAPDARIGPFNPTDIKKGEDATAAQFAETLRDMGVDDPDAWAPLLDATMDADEALDAGIITSVTPIIGDVIVAIDDTPIDVDGTEVTLDTARVVKSSAGTDQRQPTVVTRFYRISYLPNIIHKAHTPTFAYVLLVGGLAAIVFEFFSVSIGLAGIGGGVCLLMSFVAMGGLPVNWWAVLLVCAGVLAMATDVQAGRPGLRTGGGTPAVIVGSLFFTYSPFYDVRWWAILIVVCVLVAFFVLVMETIAGTRYAAPILGRGFLVGMVGTARGRLTREGDGDGDAAGVVDIDGAAWRARSASGEIGPGDSVVVTDVDGHIIEVEATAVDSGR